MEIKVNSINSKRRPKYNFAASDEDGIGKPCSCTNCKLSYLVIERDLYKIKCGRFCTLHHKIINILQASTCNRYTAQNIYKKI